MLDAQAMVDVDTTGAGVLRQAITLLKKRNITVAVSRADRAFRSWLERYHLMELIAPDQFYPTNRHAAQAFRQSPGSATVRPNSSAADTSGQTLYYPLLWNLVAVRICPVHNTGLLDTCHRCNKSHRPASRRQRIGYCPRCSCWLGTAEGQRASAGRQTAAHSEWQVYAANSAVTLIADLALNWQNGGGNESFFAGNLSQITNRLFGGSRGAFATFINCHHKSVKDWIIQAQRPSLKTILVLGYRLGVPASKLLLAPLKADEAVQLRQADKNDEPRLRPSLRRTPREKIEQTLLAALEKGSIPPSSLKSVCVAAGFHSTQASSRFPELSRRISDLHRRYRSERRNQGQRRIRDAVRSAVNELHTAGVYPSRERVQEKLARNVFLRDPVAHAERLAAIRDLGLTVRPRTG
jgi:hypothetical protein